MLQRQASGSGFIHAESCRARVEAGFVIREKPILEWFLPLNLAASSAIVLRDRLRALRRGKSRYMWKGIESPVLRFVLRKLMSQEMGNSTSFYEIRPDCDEVPKTRFRPKAGRTLSARRWRSAFSDEGELDIGKVLPRIQRGGVHPSIRGEVWEFLLGCFDPKSSSAERDSLRRYRREQYAKLKADCQVMDSSVGSGIVITTPRINQDGSPILNSQIPMGGVIDQVSSNAEGICMDSNITLKEDGLPHSGAMNIEGSDQMGQSHCLDSGDDSKKEIQGNIIMDKKIIQWMLILHQIGLDVVRTDRTLRFYETSENLAKLWDILAVYAWLDKDIGYCQGMSDLCSPIVVLLGNEADAFWCFERLMHRMRGNFRCTESSVGVEKQLQRLASITRVLDPKLYQHLEEIGGGNFLFAFRMLMVLFRREFSFGDALFLWEMMWALEYVPQVVASHQGTGLSVSNKHERVYRRAKSIGKFGRRNIKNGLQNSHDTPIAVFLVASILKAKSSKLLHEARGLDDVVKILNDLTGKLDAKKACTGALKLHKKYLHKAKKKVE